MENKTGKYLKYAIGEIVLVVIGILIALSINNLNEKNKARQREKVLLIELKSNLETNITNLNSDIKEQIRDVEIINYLIDHLDHKRPFNDSLPSYFRQADTAPDIIFTSSAFETLKSSGLDLISSDKLRQEIVNLFEISYPYLLQGTKRLEDQLWPALVAPFNQKYFRQVESGNYPNDYENLLNDKEFVNMLSNRGFLRSESTILKKEAVQKTKNVIELIDDQLNSNK
jgi:hypothetical protein